MVRKALDKCSLPLYARIAYDHIRKWKSYDLPTLDMLEVTVKGAINQLFEGKIFAMIPLIESFTSCAHWHYISLSES